jgi:dTDP-4-dehydrorhamnose reductase
MNKILLFGKGGRLGSALQRYYPDIVGISKADCDITNLAAVQRVIKQVSPTTIINCAVVSDVAYCEQHPQHAWDVNVRGVRNIAEAARENGAYMVHFSSDYALYPVNEYGWTKLASEALIRYGITIRTKFFDASYWLYQALMTGQTVELFTNTVINPISIYSLIPYVLLLIEKKPVGIINIGTRARISHYDLGMQICAAFKINKELIIPKNAFTMNYNYPLDTFMDLRDLTQLGLSLVNIEEDIQIFKKQVLTWKDENL